MIKQLAWNMFKNTGNINSYLEFVETENVEKKVIEENSKEKNLEIDMQKTEKKWE